jgi:hypothetical protein
VEQVTTMANTQTTETISTKGHRERARKRLFSSTELSDEFLLELLLMYGIPQKDVKPLAHELIREYGTIGTVLSVDHTILERKPLFKENASALFKLVRLLIDRHTKETPTSDVKETEQTSLFEPEAMPGKKTSVDPNRRKSIQLFTNAVIKESLSLAPKLPETVDWQALASYVRKSLHYNSEESRQRYASYVLKRLFPSGKADLSLIKFTRCFANAPELRDVCLYRYLLAEPLLLKVIEETFLPVLSRGFVNRDEIQLFVNKLFPSMKSNRKCVLAIVDVLTSTGICKMQNNELTFRTRKPALASFAFILHSEFPEPGMYDLKLIDTNSYFSVMMWDKEHISNAIYELRNAGIISKVSDIDGMRQFTVKYRLPELVQKLVSRRAAS